MVDVARLGLAVDSTQVEKGTVSLHQLTGAAGQASAAARQLAGASQVEAVGQKAATVAVQAHNAALMAQNTVMRSSMQQRTMMIYQLNDVAVSLASGMNPAMVVMQQGSQILQGGLMPAIRTLVDLGKSLVVTFWPVAAVIGAVSAAVAGLTYEINKTAEVQVGFFDVALAGWQLFAEQVAAWVAPVFGAMGSWLQQGWDAAAPVLKMAGNAVIGTFVGAFDAVKAAWSQLPEAIGYVAFEAARQVSNAMVRMISDVMASVNDLFSRLDSAAISLGGKASLPRLNVNEFQRQNYKMEANPFGGGAGAANAAGQAFSDAMGVDYLGSAFGALSQRAQEIALARKEMDALGGSTKAANDNAKELATDGLAKVGEFGKSVLSTLSSGFADMFKGLLRGTTSVTDALSQLLGKLGDLFIDQAFNMLFGGLSGGIGGGGGGLFGWLGGLFGFANGGVFNGGHVQPFARGGIVNGPTLFPMANGAGLMGEAGPEAIMPLRRGPDGRLGVAANSNGGSMHVSVGVTVDDEGRLQAYVKSISRQEAQSAAAVGTQVAVAQANKTASASVANYQKQRAGSDYRTM